MLNTIYFQIANHIICLKSFLDIQIIDILPAFNPFIIKEILLKEDLFTLSLVKNLSPLEDKTVITSFDWEDAQCSISENEEFYEIQLTPANSSTSWRLQCNRDFTKAVAQIHFIHQDSFAINNFLMLLFAFASAPQQTLLIHASSVTAEGQGYVFLGKSGAGKSTHSKLWIENISNSELLNDDNPILRLENGALYIYGSPWSGKTPCYKNSKYPVKAIVRLEQADQNEIIRQKAVHAFASLYPSCSKLIQKQNIHSAIQNNIIRIVESTPIYKLKCLPTKEAAIYCFEKIK